MYDLKICKIGDSLGIMLPEELLAQLKLKEGDRLFVTQTGDRLQLTTQESDFERAMKADEKVSKKYENALRELADK